MEFLHSWVVILSMCTILGWALGSIRIGHFSLGGSAVLFVAIAMGVWGFSLPPVIRDLGLIFFIYAVGAETGDGFIAALIARGPRLAFTAFATVTAGFATAILFGLWAGLSPYSVAGLFGGALTSTPALATAMDGLNTEQAALLSTAYGLAYPAGIMGVVFFVQLIGRIEGIDVSAEERRMNEPAASNSKPSANVSGKYTSNPLPVLLVLGLGYALGNLPLPLFGSSVTLGTAGGVLLCSIIAANKSHIGTIELIPHPTLRNFLREFGLYAFLAGVGMQTGAILDMDTLRAGLAVVAGSVITVLVPTLLCWWLCRRLFGMEFLPMLGAIAGCMTSTPGLAASASVSTHKSVIQSYATVYPVALLSI